MIYFRPCTVDRVVRHFCLGWQAQIPAGTRGLFVGAVICSAVLAGCGHRTISGVYVQHNDRAAMILQLTQTPDQHLSGSCEITALNPDGTILKRVMNVEGVTDDDRLTLTVRAPELLAQSLNVGGKLVNDGIDLSFPATSNSDKVGVQHLVKGNLSDYAGAVAGLEARGNAYRQLGALDQKTEKLTRDLVQFVDHAKGNWVGKISGVQNYFDKGIQLEQNRLMQVHRLLQAGGPVNESRAEAVRSGMIADYVNIENIYAGIDRSQLNEAEQEQSLTQQITPFQANCLDGTNVKPGQIIPSMGPCKALERAVSSYQAMLPRIHTEMAELVRIETSEKVKLDAIQRETDAALDHR